MLKQTIRRSMQGITAFNSRTTRRDFSSIVKIKPETHSENDGFRNYQQALFALALGLLAYSSDENKKASADASHLHVQFKELAKKRYALQYSANNPIEDRVMFGHLNSVRGEVLAVFDGHGGFSIGDLTSRLCGKKLVRRN